MNYKKLVLGMILLGSFSTLSIKSRALDYIEGPRVTNRVNVTDVKKSQSDVDKLSTQAEKLSVLNAMDPNEVATWSDFNASEFGIVGPVKDQGNKNTCWSHSIASTAETAILKEGLNPLDEVFYVSPDNIAYTSRNRIASNDSLNNTSSDLFSASNWNRGYHIGYGIERLSQWNGVYLRNNDGEYGPEGFFEPSFLLEESIRIDSTDRNKVKRAIAEYGSVTMYYNFDRYYQDSFFNPIKEPNEVHAVQIIGWDDNIAASQFSGSYTANPGGWLCKNSWGSNAYNDGMFYLSYEGEIFDTYALRFREYDKSLRNYYYDGLLGDEANFIDSEVAVVFEAKGEDSLNREMLESINVNVVGEDITVKAEVYLNPTIIPGNRMDTRNNPKSGTRVASVSKSFWTGGDRSLKLDKPVELKKGDYYSIVVSVEGKNSGVVVSNEPLSHNDLSFYFDGSSFKASYLNNYSVARINGITRLVAKDKPDNLNDIKYANITLDKDYIALDNEGTITPSISFNGETLYEGADYLLGYSREYIKPDNVAWGRVNAGRGEIRIIGLNRFSGSSTVIYYPIISGEYPRTDGVADDDTFGRIYLEASKDIKRVGDIELPYGYKWVNPNQSFSFGEELVFAVYYDGENSDKYSKINRSVIIEEAGADFISIDRLEVFGLEPSYTYTGNQIKPSLSFSLDDKAMELGKSLRIEYINNIDAGTARIILRGKGKYRGKKELSFKITPAENKISELAIADNNPIAVSRFGDVSYIYYSDNGSTVISRDEALGLSTYYVKAVAPGSINYNSAESEVIRVQSKIEEANFKTEASLRIRFNRVTHEALDVDLRFGAAIKNYDSEATYGVLILSEPLKDSYTIDELNLYRGNGHALDIDPVKDGDSYRFSWVITNMDGKYDRVLNAVAYKEKNGIIELGKPTSYSVNSVAKYYLDNNLVNDNDVILVLKNILKIN